MKPFFVVSMIFCSVAAFAYQTGPANRTNFGPGQQQGQQQYRSFSNYNNRSWGQGVQTRGVQTHVAGTEVTDFESPAKPKKAPTVGKTAVAAPAAQKNTTPAAAAPAPTQPSTAPAAMPAEAAAMMQQVQGMMNMMGGQGQGKPGQPAAVPTGMPDMSALMGGMMPGAQPQAPAKK